MSLRLSGALATLLAVTLGLTACGSSDDTGAAAAETRVFAADNGDITIPKDPQRVVATGYAVPALIEADAKLVGISSWQRGIPMMSAEDKAKYDALDKIAGETADETDYEKIALAEPDLIVIGVPAPVLGDIDLERLEGVAPVVAIGPTVPDAWRELSRRQSDAAGRTATFDRAKAAYDEKAAALKTKYAGVLGSLKFGHVGGYGQVAKGNFMREYARSWGTNIAQDVGVTYYGEVKKKGGGSLDVSEQESIELLPESLRDADAITYTLEPDGTVGPAIKFVLDSPLWKSLPAVKAGRVYPIRYTQAATYESARLTLDSLDQAFAPLLNR
ncbi:iron complex transport system substrate-binding protein [Kribbella amoyensis]|uniref:Iron complex transport system substrate-binding protein n=1 Tax=Kribbella amoyensis TaxID=996641 RepID=A0A561BVD9_9ACTN|nr:ABC transporter substrate-binding protein [Kribbella amoyensis]TWD82839.1 iron complex transport system substrate-binding protein [Kribbella amoyensis]